MVVIQIVIDREMAGEEGCGDPVENKVINKEA
jgi:hypothetical protein